VTEKLSQITKIKIKTNNLNNYIIIIKYILKLKNEF